MTRRGTATVVCNGCGTTQEVPMKMGALDGLYPPEASFLRVPRGWWATAAVWPDAETDEGAHAAGPIITIMCVCPGCAELGRFQGAPENPTRPS